MDKQGHPDNLTLDDSGRLVIATHRSRVRSGLHLIFGLAAPWDVWRLDGSRGNGKPKRLLSSDLLPRDVRPAVSAASTAAVFENRLIVSQLKKPYILVVDDYGLAVP